jgi:hypothetical protein
MGTLARAIREGPVPKAFSSPDRMPSAMNLSSWCTVDEALTIAYTNEEWRQYAGFTYSESFMKSVSEKRIDHAKGFLSEFKEPKRLYLGKVYDVADASKTPLKLELYRKREQEIVSKSHEVNGRPVTWNSWRQFNAQAASSADRKAVFDEFIDKVSLVTPTIRGMFEKSKQVESAYGTSPLQVYLQLEGLELKQLKDLVSTLGNAAKKPFAELLEHYSHELNGRSAEYYDDLYYFRGKIFEPLDQAFKGYSPGTEPERVLTRLGFPVKRLEIDAEERPGKHTSPICFGVQIPNDVRLLVRPVKPFTDLESSFHEHGHGMHFISVSENARYWDKYTISNGVAEIFSTLIERLMKKRAFLTREFKVSKEIAQDAVQRTRFMELYFLTLYAANSLMKIEYWEQNMSMDEANDRYEKYAEQFMGLRLPGRYWQLHHVMPDFDLYSPSYMVAAVRAAELDRKLENLFGASWWTDKRAGNYIRAIAKNGASIKLSQFSKLDTRPYLKDLI